MRNIFNLNDLDKCLLKARDIHKKMVLENKEAIEDGISDYHFNEKDLDFLIYAYEKFYFAKSGTLLGGEYPKTEIEKMERISKLGKAICGK